MVKKLRHVENQTKERYLKNRASDIKEFDNERRLIDTFIKKQRNDSERTSLTSRASFRGSMNSTKQLNSWKGGRPNEMVPIDVHWEVHDELAECLPSFLICSEIVLRFIVLAKLVYWVHFSHPSKALSV